MPFGSALFDHQCRFRVWLFFYFLIFVGAFFLATVVFQLDSADEWPTGLNNAHVIWIVSGSFSFLGALFLLESVRNILDEFRSLDYKEDAAPNKANADGNAENDATCLRVQLRWYSKLFIFLSIACYTFALTMFSLLISHLLSEKEPRILPEQLTNDGLWLGAFLFAIYYFVGGWPMQLLFWGELFERKGFFSRLGLGWKYGLAAWFPFSTLIAGIAGGFLLTGLITFVRDDMPELSAWLRLIFGVTATMLGILVSLGIQMMLLRRSIPPVLREWWHRLVGLIMRTILTWSLLSSALIVGAALVAPKPLIDVGVTGAWLTSAAIGVHMAVGRYVGKASEDALIRVLSNLVPWFFVVGLVILGFGFTLSHVAPGISDVECDGFFNCLNGISRKLSEEARFQGISIWLLGFSAFIVTVGIVYNVNWHSLYYLYRSRLARCFLGASNLKHRENAARFDPNDDLRLTKIVHRPVHIFCTTLNLVGSSDLAWQTRKGASFFFGPKYCGYLLPKATCESEKFADTGGFVETEKYMTPLDAEDVHAKEEPWSSHATLATAMTISGAAMAPSCGYHSNPAFAFLMGMFNVRLGRWCPNPSYKTPKFLPENHRRTDPSFGILWFIREWLGMTTEKSGFVYLSDGGHFDNTGIYELVRRRCKYIIAVDGEYDPDSSFEGLTEAVRKCYLDLHAKIEIDPSSIKKEGDGYHGKSVLARQRLESRRAVA